jgi:tetratricopeptide (TPR) repeat protein
MTRNDWFLQTTWSEAQASSFFERLARSRTPFHRAQYLRIQALTLANTGEPANISTALGLLERIFRDNPDKSQLPLAYLQAANCHDVLGNIEEATSHFRRALEAQRQYPNDVSGVAHEFPWFIVRRGLVDLYDEALEALATADSFLPAQRFREAACRAFIAAHGGEREAARALAQAALAAAGLKRSPFDRHPTIGLVSEADMEWAERLELLASA